MSHELNFKQWHHGYLGLLLIGGAIFEWKHSRTLGIILLVVGCVVLLDDLVQHLVQAITKTEWQSPLHRLYGWLYTRSAAIRAVNGWLDSLFD